MKKTALFIILTIVLAGCALQKDVYLLEDRVVALEQRNRKLQERSKHLEAQERQAQATIESLEKSRKTEIRQLRENYARVAADLDRIDQEARLAQGRLEEVEFALSKKLGKAANDFQQRNKQLESIQKKLVELELRLANLEQYVGIENGSKAGASKQTKAAPAVVTPESLYQAAKQDFDKGRFASARKGFNELIKAFPKSEKADNAQFWIGESYYREKWYEKAILEYQEVIDKYPRGNKVPAAMLKQAMAFLKLKDKANARLVLTRLIDKFPKSNEAKLAAKKLKSL